jgi:hypothetical protein
MSVISVAITNSAEEITKGIPRSIAISTSSIATIFYTLDGTTPDTASNVYFSAIQTPTNKSGLVLKVFATDGTDSSPVLTFEYGTVLTGRLPHSTVTGTSISDTNSLFPFGSNVPRGDAKFGPNANAGLTIENPFNTSLPQISNGFDDQGTPNDFTNATLDSYPIIYSITDSIGQTGRGVGNLPATVTVSPSVAPPEVSNRSDKLFNPRALVVYQDQSLESPDDPAFLNREYFSLQNPEKYADGNLFFNAGLDSPAASGAFVKNHFNPKDNTMTYYYFDSSSNRWIISKQPYQEKDPDMYNFAQMVFPRNKPEGGGVVFAWRQFARRILF